MLCATAYGQNPYWYTNPGISSAWVFPTGGVETSIADATGNGRDMTVVSPYWVERLPGVGAARMYGLTNVIYQTNKYENLRAFSIGAWIKPVKIVRIGRFDVDGEFYATLLMLHSNSNVYHVVRNNEGGYTYYNYGAAITGWHHYVMTWTNNSKKLYIDGIERPLTGTELASTTYAGTNTFSVFIDNAERGDASHPFVHFGITSSQQAYNICWQTTTNYTYTPPEPPATTNAVNIPYSSLCAGSLLTWSRRAYMPRQKDSTNDIVWQWRASYAYPASVPKISNAVPIAQQWTIAADVMATNIGGPYCVGMAIVSTPGYERACLLFGGTDPECSGRVSMIQHLASPAVRGITSGTNGSWGSADYGVWRKVVSTYDGSRVCIYKDGEMQGLVSNAFPGVYHTNLSVVIGSDSDAPTYSHRFYGSISNVVIWDRCLSPFEVENIGAY